MTRRVTKIKAFLKFYTRLDAISLHEKPKSFTFYRHFKWHISLKLSLLAHLLSPKYYRYTNIYISPSYTGINLTNNFNRKKQFTTKSRKNVYPVRICGPMNVFLLDYKRPNTTKNKQFSTFHIEIVNEIADSP